MRKIVSAAAVLLLAASAQAAFVITDPSSMNTASVNGNSEAVAQSAGNISLTNYNAIASKRVFNFDNFTSTGNNDAEKGDGGKLTATADSVTVTFGFSGLGNFAFITTGDAFTTSTSTTGIVQSLQHNRGTVTITFNNAVDAVGMMLARLAAADTVTLTLADSTQKVYSIPANNGNTFFGYSNANESPASSKVKSLTLSTGIMTQYGIDDFSFVKAVPEPTAAMAVVGASMVGLMRRR